MALLKIRCPECKAPLKSSAGFTVGQTVCCPKCETHFAVEEPAGETEEPGTSPKGKGKVATATRKPLRATAGDDEDTDEGVKKPKKKKRVDDDEYDDEPTRSYKNSPLRYVVLGVLVLTMLILGLLLYDKRKSERELADGNSSSDDGTIAPPSPLPLAPAELPGGGGAKGGPKGGPKGGFKGGDLKGKQPVGPRPEMNPGNAPSSGLFGTPAPGSESAAALTEKFKKMLVSSKWVADLGDGVTQELTYETNGTFTTSLSGPEKVVVSGKYTIRQPVGTKGLKIQLDTTAGPQTVTAIFEDDELQHPTLRPGLTGTFRKK